MQKETYYRNDLRSIKYDLKSKKYGFGAKPPFVVSYTIV